MHVILTLKTGNSLVCITCTLPILERVIHMLASNSFHEIRTRDSHVCISVLH